MPTKDRLRALFMSEHVSLVRFFRRATGSSSLAEDLAQEAFLRLAAADVAAITSPAAYLRRVSSNIAMDRQRMERRRRLSQAEIDGLLDVPDEAADPEARLIAKDQVERMLRALAELPPRRRDILLAARIEGTPHRQLAERYAVSTRTIEIEIRKALEHCARALLG